MPTPYSVLLVEDDDPLRGALHDLLCRRGFHVYATGLGDEAIELARRVQLDFSILDMHLRGTTGLEVLRTIMREVRPLPSIMISGAATTEEQRKALDLGVFSFLSKPIEADRLRSTLDLLIRHHLDSRRSSPPPHG